jgi:3-oxoacyl-[acyl-carrier-protein] synthase-3
MEGQEVFRKAVRLTVDTSTRTLERAGLSTDDIDLVIPHQANQRIIDAASRRLGIPDERVVTVLGHTGNTSAGSIPLALAAAADDGRLQPGHRVLFVGFGAGMTAASAVLVWRGAA